MLGTSEAEGSGEMSEGQRGEGGNACPAYLTGQQRKDFCGGC